MLKIFSSAGGLQNCVLILLIIKQVKQFRIGEKNAHTGHKGSVMINFLTNNINKN